MKTIDLPYFLAPLSFSLLLWGSPAWSANLGGWNTEGLLDPFTINDPTLQAAGITLSELDMVATANSGYNNAPCINEGCPASIYQTNSNSDFGGQAWQTGSVWRNNDLSAGQDPLTAAGSYYRFTIEASNNVEVTLDQLSLLLSVNGNNSVQIAAYGELGDTPGGLDPSNTNLMQLGSSVSQDLQSNRFREFTLSLADLTASGAFSGKATIYFIPLDTAGGNGFVPGTDIAVDNIGFTGTAIDTTAGPPPSEIPEPSSTLPLFILGTLGTVITLKGKLNRSQKS